MNDKTAYILTSERELIKQSLAGNRMMQNKLYAQFAPVMLGVCLRYAKSRCDAEEILQEGFIKVFTSLAQYKFKGSLEGWIKRIMINCALQILRNKNDLYLAANQDIVSDEFIYKDSVLDSINEKELILLVQQLPIMCRLVFNLYVFEGFKHNEIAKLLNIAEGTSKSNLHDARRLLQRKLFEQGTVMQIHSGA